MRESFRIMGDALDLTYWNIDIAAPKRAKKGNDLLIRIIESKHQ